MTTLLIPNDPVYGTERSYNDLRLANALTGKVCLKQSRQSAT